MCKTKLQTLLDEYGMDELEMMENAMMDNTCPAICMNPGCDAIYDYEPDQDSGWCDECHTNSVKSGMLLMGGI